MYASRTNHDQLFKELLRLFFVEFVEAFLPQVMKYLDKDSIQFLDKEIFDSPDQGQRHEVDLVVRCKFKAKPAFFLFHVEHQAQKQNLFGRRMFHYFALLHKKHDLPIYPVVIFSHDNPALEPEVFTVEFPDLKVLEFRYRVVQLNRLPWRGFLSKKNPAVCALMSRMKIKSGDRARVKLECLRMLVTLKVNKAKQHFLGSFIDTYLRLNQEEILIFQKATDTLKPEDERKQIMKLMTSWEEKGMQTGLQTGRQEGRQEGQIASLRDAIAEVLELRFGNVPYSLRESIQAITNADKLKQLHRIAVTTKDLEHIEKAL